MFVSRGLDPLISLFLLDPTHSTLPTHNIKRQTEIDTYEPLCLLSKAKPFTSSQWFIPSLLVLAVYLYQPVPSPKPQPRQPAGAIAGVSQLLVQVPISINPPQGRHHNNSLAVLARAPTRCAKARERKKERGDPILLGSAKCTLLSLADLVSRDKKSPTHTFTPAYHEATAGRDMRHQEVFGYL